MRHVDPVDARGPLSVAPSIIPAAVRAIPTRDPASSPRPLDAAKPEPRLDLATVRRAWLLGIGGVGLSGAAELLLGRGIEVAGTDRAVTGGRLERLRALGVRVVREEEAAVPAGTDLVVASAALPPDHPRILAARAAGLPVFKYAELLGALMTDRHAVCVAGSHGKTTTSCLVAWGLEHAGRDPSYVVGGDLVGRGTGARHGRGPHFVAESCEYDRTFLRHRPTVAVVLNVDEDHLDYYRDLAEIQAAFCAFAARVPADGLVLVQDEHAALFVGHPDVRARVETFGFSQEADWLAGEPQHVGTAHRSVFSLAHRGVPLGRFTLGLLGRHAALNGTAAAAALLSSGLSLEEARAALASFPGVGRRMEQIHDAGDVLVLDDYAHHPAEIRAVVRALRARYPGRRLVAVFQPHQASRTRCLIADFSTALAEADVVWMPPIYFARDSEEEQRRVTSADLAARIRAEGGLAEVFPDLEAVADHAAGAVRPGDVVVTMGAGNVNEVAHGLARRLR